MRDGVIIESAEDLHRCPTRCLLELADELADDMLPLFVALIKRADKQGSLFHKLMGDHEEDNGDLVDRFFRRYRKLVMDPANENLNPLKVYLPPACFQDLIFVQSREHFFKRQTIEHINEYLQHCFKETVTFNALQHDEAWSWFFNRVMEDKP